MKTLQDKLDAFKSDFESNRISKDTVAVMHRTTDDLRTSGILDRTVKLGDRLPGFELENQDGEVVKLERLLENGPVVINFFRGVWCPYCMIELEALNQAADKIRRKGGTLVAISPQLHASAKRTQQSKKLTFDVLVDEANAYARELGLAHGLLQDLREIYLGFGIDLPQHNGDESWELPMPFRAVADRDGTIRYLNISPDYTVRPEIDEAIAVLEQLTTAAAA